MIKPRPETEQQSDKTQKNQNFTEYFFFIAINILFVGISAYQTYVGYQADVAGNQLMAYAIAAAVAILFLAMNFEIRRRRKNGEKHYKQLWLYILPFGLAFFGNFNAFYANQTRGYSMEREVNSFRSHLAETYDEANQAIRRYANINEFEQNYNTRLNALKNEYNRPPVGWGREAENRWGELVRFFNNNGGNLSSNVLGNTSGSARYNRAIASAQDEYENIVTSKTNEVEPTEDAIVGRYTEVVLWVDDMTSQIPPVYSQRMLDDMVSAENFIRSQASSLIGTDAFFTNPPLKTSATSQIGTIKDTLKKAFVEWEAPSATFFALFISLLIDLSALLYILVFIRYNKKDGRGRVNSGPQRI